MPAGRPPKPKAIKELQGTHRKSRDLPDEMTVPALKSVPMPPEDLPQAAHSVWYRVAAELQALKVLSSLDLDMLKAYCYQVHLMDLALHHIETEGLTIIMQNKGGGIYPVKSPYIAIYNDALTQSRSLAIQFGLTPSSRTKIATGQVKETPKNPFDGF